MNTNKIHRLLFAFYLVIGNQILAVGVTDEELEALEQQIEQQEIMQKEKADAEKKAKKEAERLAKEKKILEEERKKFEEEKKRAKLEQKRKEEEQHKAEQAKKEKYDVLISEAVQAINDKDKALALIKYNEALVLKPNNHAAINGIEEARKLKDKICYEVLGEWIWDNQYKLNIKENGKFTGTGIGERTWSCSNPENRAIVLDIPLDTMNATLSEDGKCLQIKTKYHEGCYVRP